MALPGTLVGLGVGVEVGGTEVGTGVGALETEGLGVAELEMAELEVAEGFADLEGPGLAVAELGETGLEETGLGEGLAPDVAGRRSGMGVFSACTFGLTKFSKSMMEVGGGVATAAVATGDG